MQRTYNLSVNEWQPSEGTSYEVSGSCPVSRALVEASLELSCMLGSEGCQLLSSLYLSHVKLVIVLPCNALHLWRGS